MQLAILCPGQGSQHASMFDAFDDADAASSIASASAAAGFDIVSAVRDPATSRAMFDNAVAQPLLVAYHAVVWSALAPRLADAGIAPAIVAGYSVGELSSHAVAGALTWADAIALARLRAAAMDAAAGADDGLVAIRGISRRRIEPIVASHGASVAIVNGDDHVLVGGPRSALDGVMRDVSRDGGTAQPLPVRVAAHTPSLAAAVAPFAAALAARPWSAPRPVLAGIDAARVRDRTGAIDALSRQIAEPVRWDACMDALVERGVTTCLELGPANALARMMRERHPAVEARSVADFRRLDGVVGWVNRTTG